MKKNKHRKQAGFTLIELMVVVVIIAILAGLVIPRFMGETDKAKQAKAKMQIESLESALKMYKLDNGSYPSTEQGLQALVEAPTAGNLPTNRSGILSSPCTNEKYPSSDAGPQPGTRDR